MQRILYAGGALETGDEIARAMMTYAALLARLGRTEAVTIPVAAGPGEPSEASLIIGAGMPIATVAIAGAQTALPRDIVFELEHRVEVLQQPMHAVPDTTPHWVLDPYLDI